MLNLKIESKLKHLCYLHVLFSLLTSPCFLTEQSIPRSSYIFAVPYMEFAS